MITDLDLAAENSVAEEKHREQTSQSLSNITPDDLESLTQQLLDGFDPETNLIDRRILFDATGVHLGQNDFTEVSESKMTELFKYVASPDIS